MLSDEERAVGGHAKLTAGSSPVATVLNTIPALFEFGDGGYLGSLIIADRSGLFVPSVSATHQRERNRNTQHV